MVIYSDVDWLDRSPCGWLPPPSPPWGGRPWLRLAAGCWTAPRTWWTGRTCEHQSNLFLVFGKNITKSLQQGWTERRRFRQFLKNSRIIKYLTQTTLILHPSYSCLYMGLFGLSADHVRRCQKRSAHSRMMGEKCTSYLGQYWESRLQWGKWLPACFCKDELIWKQFLPETLLNKVMWKGYEQLLSYLL